MPNIQNSLRSLFNVLFLFLLSCNVYAQSPDKELLAKGVKCLDVSKYDEAITIFNKVIEGNSNYSDAYFDRGLAYEQKRDWGHAISDFSKVIDLNPKDGEAYYSRGHAYDQNNDLDRAIADYSKAINIVSDVHAYYGRGRLYYIKKDYDRSLADINKAMALGYKIDPEWLQDVKERRGRLGLDFKIYKFLERPLIQGVIYILILIMIIAQFFNYKKGSKSSIFSFTGFLMLLLQRISHTLFLISHIDERQL
jgi:tetratricopeptide (TPR) repeat protein